MNNLSNQKIKELYDLPNRNLLADEKIIADYINRLTVLAELTEKSYGCGSQRSISTLARELVDCKTDPDALDKALQEFKDRGTFPKSLAEIKNSTKLAVSEDGISKAEKKHREAFGKEERRFNYELNKIIVFLGGGEIGVSAVSQYYKKWLSMFMGNDYQKHLGLLGDSKFFLKCAIFDLVEAEEAGIEGAIKVMRRKQSEINKRIA